MLDAKVTVHSASHSLQVLIDPRAEQSFMDASLAIKLKIDTQALPHSLQVTALNGQLLPNITHVTESVSLTLSGNHIEMLQFYAFHAPLTPLVLGFPWLRQHNPVLDWKEERVLG